MSGSGDPTTDQTTMIHPTHAKMTTAVARQQPRSRRDVSGPGSPRSPNLQDS
jgi:hypothetical protein